MNSTQVSTVFPEHELVPVELHNDLHPRIKVRPMYFELGFSPSPKIYARQLVLSRLLQMLPKLPQQYNILIYDVYRPRAVQGVLFEWMRGEIRKHMPHLSDEENFTETRKYASVPSVVGDAYTSPHLSGGAIDLTLIDSVTGEECDMGTPFDDCTTKAHRNYYTNLSSLTAEDKIIKARRDLLQELMESVGFTSYQYEWWHFDIGDVLWSRATGNPEAFGALFGDREWL